jgi:hypothetical protein
MNAFQDTKLPLIFGVFLYYPKPEEAPRRADINVDIIVIHVHLFFIYIYILLKASILLLLLPTPLPLLWNLHKGSEKFRINRPCLK